MITPADFITIPYTPDMTQGGIAYACKSLPYTYNRMGTSPFKRLRRIVAGVAVELAFRRYLTQENIPHDNLGATPFTDPDRYDISIGGRRCDIKSFLLIHKDQIRKIRENPKQLLDAQALVPADQISSSHLGDDDLYIFAFFTALLTPNRRTLEKALQANQPIYLICPLPKEWAHPQKWAPLGTLALKSDASRVIKIELGGQDSEHKMLSEQVILKPGKRTTAKQKFHALHFLHTPDIPDGPVGVHSPALKETHIVDPLEWGNIWIYGMEIIFAGYMTRGEFRRKARHLPAGSRVFQYPRTSTPNLALPIGKLNPLKSFFSQAKAWSKGNTN
ncbi:MAG: hypothetical protein ISS57_14985 [Anaerolineales bacterium]|nr:hypothetical protein [Anaerolineales bacterium]